MNRNEPCVFAMSLRAKRARGEESETDENEDQEIRFLHAPATSNSRVFAKIFAMLRALRYTVCFGFLRKIRLAFAHSLQPLAYATSRRERAVQRVAPSFGFWMIWSQNLLSYCQSTHERWLRVALTALAAVDLGNGIQGLSGIYIIWHERLLWS
jgi:hypothetical protein